jgi:hypothetical protein
MPENYINMHKRIAMGQPHAETHLKKGGSVKRYASGGAVAESKAANLPARGDKRNAGVDFNAGKSKVATMKRGGGAKKPGIMIAIAVGKKGAARGR